MAESLRANITATGHYLPDYVLTNKELEEMVETNDEWIRTRTGIVERRILKDPDKASAYMGIEAAREVIRNRNINPLDIDVIILSTATPDYLFPSTSCLIQREIGAFNAYCFDLMAACSGFLYALTNGATFIESGRYKNVLVIGSDKMSSITDYTDRATCILFGDAAAAVLLEPAEDDSGVIDWVHHSNGTGAEVLRQEAGGSLNPATHETVEQRKHYIFQDGKTVFKKATEGMADVSREIMDRNNLSNEDVQWLVPHQANLRIIDATAKRMGLSSDNVMVNIDKYGNTTTATIPLCLYDWQPRLKKGDNLILSAFGGGFTWGAVYVKWGLEN